MQTQNPLIKKDWHQKHHSRRKHRIGSPSHLMDHNSHRHPREVSFANKLQMDFKSLNAFFPSQCNIDDSSLLGNTTEKGFERNSLYDQTLKRLCPKRNLPPKKRYIKGDFFPNEVRSYESPDNSHRIISGTKSTVNSEGSFLESPETSSRTVSVEGSTVKLEDSLLESPETSSRTDSVRVPTVNSEYLLGSSEIFNSTDTVMGSKVSSPTLQLNSLKLQDFHPESDDVNEFIRHGNIESEKKNPDQVSENRLKISALSLIEEPLDLSLHESRTNEHKINQEHSQILDPISGSIFLSTSEVSPCSVRTDGEINGMQNNEQLPHDDLVPHKSPVNVQSLSDDYLLLPGSNHKEDELIVSDEWFVTELKPENTSDEFESLLNSIAHDKVVPELMIPGIIEESDAVELQTISVEDLTEKSTPSFQSLAERKREVLFNPEMNERRKESITKADRVVETVQMKVEKAGRDEMDVVEQQEEDDPDNQSLLGMRQSRYKERTSDDDSDNQSLLVRRKFRHKKRTSDVDRCSFTRLKRSEQMKIDPERAKRLREENNAACRRNRLRKMNKLKEMERELLKLKEIAKKYTDV